MDAAARVGLLNSIGQEYETRVAAQRIRLDIALTCAPVGHVRATNPFLISLSL